MKTKQDKSEVGDPTVRQEKNEAKKIKKNYINLEPPERANLKQLGKRKFISQKALKQILALLLFDKGITMTEVMEELALSPQTLLQWRKDFKEKRMDSLFVFLEKKKDEDDEKGEDDTNNDESDTTE